MVDQTVPTLEDVARLAQVSTATVSRCLNAPERVASGTRERIQAAVDSLGYAPNFSAKALVTRRTDIIGAVIPTLASAIFSRAIHAFQGELDKLGWTLVLAASDSNRETEARQIRALIARGVDGLLLVGAERDESVYRFLKQRNMPYVIGWTSEVMDGQSCVGFDNGAAMRELTEKALELGHRRFGVISAPVSQNDRARSRVAGVRQTLAGFGLPASALQVAEVPYEIDAAAEAFDGLMAGAVKPTVVMCGNDVQAAGAIRRAQQTGLQVPRDISITGFDNLEHAELVEPAITTVDVPHVEMGTRAATVLIDQLRGAQGARQINLEAPLVTRGSLGPAPD
jgi:LacI family transcriptional regulator